MREGQKIALRVDPLDNVATVFAEGIQAGDCLTVRDQGGREEKMTAQNAVPYGHKIAVKNISRGEAVIKYGQKIGAASQKIAAGVYVHVHNMEAMRGRGDRKNSVAHKTGEEI